MSSNIKIIAAVFLIGSLLAGCGGSFQAQNLGPDAATQRQTEAAERADRESCRPHCVVPTVPGTGSGETPQEEQELIEQRESEPPAQAREAEELHEAVIEARQKKEWESDGPQYEKE